MKKSTPKSRSKENNNCTVLALKSVTGWSYQKCFNILAKAGREKDRGFNVFSFLGFIGKHEDVEWDLIYSEYNAFYLKIFMEQVCEEWDIEIESPEYYKSFFSILEEVGDRLDYLGIARHDEKPVTLKQFIKDNPKGVYYITVKSHALAVIDGVIVDNLLGKEAGMNRHVVKAWKFDGNIKPDLGVQTTLDSLFAERHPKLLENEVVVYAGKRWKCNQHNKVLLQPGQIVIANKQINNTVIIELYHPIIDEGYTLTVERSYLKTLKKRSSVTEDEAITLPDTVEVHNWCLNC